MGNQLLLVQVGMALDLQSCRLDRQLLHLKNSINLSLVEVGDTNVLAISFLH